MDEDSENDIHLGKHLTGSIPANIIKSFLDNKHKPPLFCADCCRWFTGPGTTRVLAVTISPTWTEPIEYDFCLRCRPPMEEDDTSQYSHPRSESVDWEEHSPEE